jgi:hypothetical protein
VPQTRSNSSEASEQLCYDVGTHGDTQPCRQARKHSHALFDSSKFSNTQSVTPDETPMLEYKVARSLTHTKTYMQADPKYGSTYDRGLVHKLARVLSYSDACVHNRRLNSRTLVQTPPRILVLTKALLKTRTLDRTHAWMHMLLHELTVAAKHS